MTDQSVSRIVVAPEEEPSSEDRLYEKVAGALMGGAIADALGWPTEFAKKPEDLDRVGLSYPLKDFRPWHKRAGGRFFTRLDNVQPGDYSDDTQLTLSVARALLPDGTVDNEYFAKLELRYWLGYARGAGATITAAAKSAGRARSDWRWNYFTFMRGRHNLDYRGAGANGAAMRIAPIALANLHDPEALVREIWRNAIVTHGHPRAILGALVYGEALRRLAIGGALDVTSYVAGLQSFVSGLTPVSTDPDRAYWLSHWNEGQGTPFEELWAEHAAEMHSFLDIASGSRSRPLEMTYRLLGCLEPATKGSGTGSVAAAIAVFLRHGRNFESLVLEATNMLGSDTDTIGSMAASLAGAWLGYTEIPERWATLMADYTYLNRVAELVTLVALRREPHNLLRLEGAQPSAPQKASLLAALTRQDVVKGHRYWHPLLGLGWVSAVDSQEVGRPRVLGRVIMATVQFDVGQTCKFTSYTALGKPRTHEDGIRPQKKRDQLGFDI